MGLGGRHYDGGEMRDVLSLSLMEVNHENWSWSLEADLLVS